MVTVTKVPNPTSTRQILKDDEDRPGPDADRRPPRLAAVAAKGISAEVSSSQLSGTCRVFRHWGQRMVQPERSSRRCSERPHLQLSRIPTKNTPAGHCRPRRHFARATGSGSRPCDFAMICSRLRLSRNGSRPRNAQMTSPLRSTINVP